MKAKWNGLKQSLLGRTPHPLAFLDPRLLQQPGPKGRLTGWLIPTHSPLATPATRAWCPGRRPGLTLGEWTRACPLLLAGFRWPSLATLNKEISKQLHVWKWSQLHPHGQFLKEICRLLIWQETPGSFQKSQLPTPLKSRRSLGLQHLPISGMSKKDFDCWLTLLGSTQLLENWRHALPVCPFKPWPSTFHKWWSTCNTPRSPGTGYFRHFIIPSLLREGLHSRGCHLLKWPLNVPLRGLDLEFHRILHSIPP